MELVELRNLDEAREYVLQGLWLQRVVHPTAALVRPALEWALEIASGGQPLPPVGFVADLGNVAYGHDRGRPAKDQTEVPGWPHALARSYEDHLLGKVYADWSFERATDALRRYTGRDQAKGLAYVVKQVRERARLGGVELSPAVLRGMVPTPGEELLAQGYTSLTEKGPMPLLIGQYEALVRAARRLAEVLGPEDVIALEQRTALADMGQYVAHRQILQMTARLEARLPSRPPRPLAGRKEVPTRVLDEDQYPVGGYSSIATRGSIESLLHSQLAYMESPGPDLFDLKFVRDELFYYSRDENQFLRRRRAFVFAFYPDLVAARFKDAELPTQRIVLALSAVLTLVRRLTEWLSTDALRFEVLFVRSGGDKPLGDEAELLQLLLREPIERGAAEGRWVDGPAGVEQFLLGQARHSQVHCLTVSAELVRLDSAGVVVSRLTVDGPRPTLTDGGGRDAEFDAEDAFDHWAAAVVRVLELWV
ncbi:MAG TPA: hypothetical protein VFG68_05130 [Fimbriiglobus sp.]|nr:hypothetical protein [Fimbriiglobus sp.]